MLRRSAVLSALALLLVAPQLFGQADEWQRKWYWGAEAGIFSFSSPVTNSRKMALTMGGHWMITGKSSALYLAIDEILFGDSTQSMIPDASAASTGGLRLVDFSRGRSIQASIYAIPLDRKLQVMVGGGFAIHQITDAQAEGPFGTQQEAINANNAVAEVETKAFMVLALGGQYRFGKKLAAFAAFNLMPAAKDFLIPGDQVSLKVGVRYALTSSHEDVTTDR